MCLLLSALDIKPSSSSGGHSMWMNECLHSFYIYLWSCDGEGNGIPLQYSCLENAMDGGAWKAAVHGVAKSWTRLSDFTFTFMHWRRKWQPTPVFLPGESQGQGSLVGCRLWGHTESDTPGGTQLKWLSSSSSMELRRKLSTEELMLLNCGVGEDSWESLGLQGDPNSPFWRRSALGFLWKEWC